MKTESRSAVRQTVSAAAVVVSILFVEMLTGVQAWGQELSVEVLSSFPELVTGGDALVKVTGRASPQR